MLLRIKKISKIFQLLNYQITQQINNLITQ